MKTVKNIFNHRYLSTLTKNIFKSSNIGLKENTNTEGKMMSDSTNELYQKYMAFNGIMLEEYDPLEIAAIMVIQGMTFYKSCMSDHDYQRMIKSIYDQRDEVKTFG